MARLFRPRATPRPMHETEELGVAKRRAISAILELPPEPTPTEDFERLCGVILAEMVGGHRPITPEDELEARCIALVELVIAAPQASKHQARAFSELLPLILPILDRHSRRHYLPKDESDAAAIVALVGVREHNFQSLRRFLESRRLDPSRRLTSWLRKPCGWAISHRLRKLVNTGLLAGDEDAVMAVEQRERSTTLILNRLIDAETDALRNLLYSEAEGGLSEPQRRSLAIYFAMREGTLPDEFPEHERRGYESCAAKLGAHERTRAAYARIATLLDLPDAGTAKRLVTSAKQRLTNALERLARQEAAATEEED